MNLVKWSLNSNLKIDVVNVIMIKIYYQWFKGGNNWRTKKNNRLNVRSKHVKWYMILISRWYNQKKKGIKWFRFS